MFSAILHLLTNPMRKMIIVNNQKGFIQVFIALIFALFLGGMLYFAWPHIPHKESGHNNEGDYRVELIETERDEKFLEPETQTVDNLDSSEDITQKITLTKEWRKQYFIEHEENSTTTQQVELPLDVTLEAEKEIKKRFSITLEEKQTFAYEFTLSVPAKTSSIFEFEWKEIWQHGKINVYKGERLLQSIPFRVSSILTCGQKHSTK